MNNLEKKQERLKRIEVQYEKSKNRTERLNREMRDLRKEIEMESMADVFQEGKVNNMTVSDWQKVKDSISTGALQEFLNRRYGGEQISHINQEQEETTDNDEE